MENTIFHVYDKMFKKILTLSSKAVINLINGLFGTNHPADSTIQYNWTEFENDELKKILADTILTINKKYSYHLEAQMTKDETIVFRVFEYGFAHADRNRLDNESFYELPFPEPKIIYLSPEGFFPDKYILRLNFGTQGYFDYKINTFIFNEISTEELNQRKMVILIPFKLLKLRKSLAKSRSEKNLEALKSLIQNDIIGSIETNLQLKNITLSDSQRLKNLTHKLYQQIYSHYQGMESVNEMTDESLILEYDIIEKEHEKELAEKISLIQLKETEIEKRDSEIREKNSEIQEKDSEILALQERIARLEAMVKKQT